MKKSLFCVFAALTLLFSCHKKKDVLSPVVSDSKVDTTSKVSLVPPIADVQYSSGSTDYIEQVKKAVAKAGISATEVSENSTILSHGTEKYLIESENGELFVSNVAVSNARLTKTPLKSAGAKNGGFYGIMIYVTQSNYKEIIAWFEDKDNSPFEVLFGEELYLVLNGAKPDADYVFAPKMNVKKLPSGAFETLGNLSAKKKGNKVSITGESAGLFGFHMEEQTYAAGPAFSVLATTKLTDKDYVMADGVVYPGSKDASKSTSFIFLLGLGKGTSNPPMGGIMIGCAVGKSSQSAVIFIGVFGGLKIK